MLELNRNRRAFLRFLAASPALPAAVSAVWAQDQVALLKDPKEALNILEFEEAARRALPPAHLGYMASGVDDELTLRANREGFKQFKLRARRLVDVSKTDLTTEAFGTSLEMPLYICPVGGQMAFHPDGELGTARAAGAKKIQMMLSTQTTKPIEDVMKAAGRPIWFQLYTSSRWEVTERLVKHAQDAGASVVAFTVDQQGGRNTETATRLRRTDTRNCSGCHEGGTPQTFRQYKPMYNDIADVANLGLVNPALTWEAVERLKKFTTMKVVLKGIVTGDDAKLAREHGADGIVVSNHGGRAEESGRGTIECLPEVIDGAGNLPVLIDGGFRRGTDVYKALALGAKAAGFGRPYIWGLSAFGQAGVERVVDMMRAELALTMRQLGTPTVKSITKAAIIRA